MLTQVECLELAKAYVALSNAHRIELIKPMFSKTSIYRSSAVGEFQGDVAITEMMQKFFATFPDVHWQVAQYECRKARVSFEFEMNATNAKTGDQLRRHGNEIIEFDANGLIRELVVDAT